MSDEPLLDHFSKPFGARLRSIAGSDIDNDSELISQSSSQTKAIVIGFEEDDGLQSQLANDVLESLISHSKSLQFLEGIYLGPLEFRHFEDRKILEIDRLLNAFPGLRDFGLHDGYGGSDVPSYALGHTRHIGLKKLLFKGKGVGLGSQLNNCVFPNIETTVLDVSGGFEIGGQFLRSIFENHFPALKHLEMPGSDAADDVIAILCSTGLIRQLEQLNLQNGWFTDDGADALLKTPDTISLKRLDLGFHFASSSLVNALDARFENVSGRMADANNEDWRFVQINRLYRRICERSVDDYIIRLECLPHHELSILDEVAVKGKVRFHDNETAVEYIGEVLENPTWMDIALEANKMQTTTGDLHHIFLEDIGSSISDPDLEGVKRGVMGFGS